MLNPLSIRDTTGAGGNGGIVVGNCSDKFRLTPFWGTNNITFCNEMRTNYLISNLTTITFDGCHEARFEGSGTCWFSLSGQLVWQSGDTGLKECIDHTPPSLLCGGASHNWTFPFKLAVSGASSRNLRRKTRTGISGNILWLMFYVALMFSATVFARPATDGSMTQAITQSIQSGNSSSAFPSTASTSILALSNKIDTATQTTPTSDGSAPAGSVSSAAPTSTITSPTTSPLNSPPMRSNLNFTNIDRTAEALKKETGHPFFRDMHLAVLHHSSHLKNGGAYGAVTFPLPTTTPQQNKSSSDTAGLAGNNLKRRTYTLPQQGGGLYPGTEYEFLHVLATCVRKDGSEQVNKIFGYGPPQHGRGWNGDYPYWTTDVWQCNKSNSFNCWLPSWPSTVSHTYNWGGKATGYIDKYNNYFVVLISEEKGDTGPATADFPVGTTIYAKGGMNIWWVQYGGVLAINPLIITIIPIGTVWPSIGQMGPLLFALHSMNLHQRLTRTLSIIGISTLKRLTGNPILIGSGLMGSQSPILVQSIGVTNTTVTPTSAKLTIAEATILRLDQGTRYGDVGHMAAHAIGAWYNLNAQQTTCVQKGECGVFAKNGPFAKQQAFYKSSGGDFSNPGPTANQLALGLRVASAIIAIIGAATVQPELVYGAGLIGSITGGAGMAAGFLAGT
ncbi:hypothetical protein HDU76_007718, partial [Blyttiomyces sp. JEL0837]